MPAPLRPSPPVQGLAWGGGLELTGAARFRKFCYNINIITYHTDQARSREFYAIALGMAPRLDVPGMTEFELSGGCVLGLMPEKGIKRLLPGLPDPEKAGGARAEVYLIVADPAAYHARALAAGAVELSPLAPRDWGHKAAYSLDLDGHVLAFAAKLP